MNLGRQSVSTSNQKRNPSNKQAVPKIEYDGVIALAENLGDVIAYRGDANRSMNLGRQSVSTFNQKRNPSNKQAVSNVEYDGVIVLENRGDAIAYRGYNPPPEESNGTRRYGKIRNFGHAIGFDQLSPHEGGPQDEGSSNQSKLPMKSQACQTLNTI